jgi:fibronectin-binding autotransporter adhesin
MKRNNVINGFRWGLVMAVSLTTQSLNAGTIWDGGGGTGNTSISTATNWNDNVVNALDGTTAATFGTGGSTATINVNTSFTGVTINRAANFTIANGSGSLTLGGGGITVNLPSTTSRSHSISESSLILNGSQTWEINNNGAGVATLTVSSAISESVASDITKSGSGLLVLSGNTASTFTGSILVSAGTLRASKNSAFGASDGGVSISAGAVVDLNGQTIGAEAFTINGSGISSGGALINSNSASSSVSGTVNLATSSSIGGTGAINLSGAISGSGTLTKIGTGTVSLSGTNTYSGGTVISAGTLSFVDTNAKPASGTHAFGPGTTLGLGLSGAAGFTPADFENALAGSMVGNLSNITIDATTIIGIDTTFGDFTYSTVIPASFTKGLVKLGANSLTLAAADAYTGVITIRAGAIRVKSGTQLGTSHGGTVVTASDAALEIDGTDGAVTVGAEPLSLNGFGVGNTGAMRNIAGDNAFGGPITLTANSRIDSNSGTLTLNNASAITASNFGLNVGGPGNVTISGAIATGSGYLTRDGGGTLTLSGTNTYTGLTDVQNGRIVVGSATAFGASGIGNGALSIIGTGVFDLNGFNAAVTNISASSISSSITNTGASDATLSISNSSSLISSVLSDGPTNKLAVALRNNNSSALSFARTALSTFSGGLILLDGTPLGSGTRLRINDDITGTPFGSGPIIIGQAATDKAGILFNGFNNTIGSPIVFNTSLGTDRYGIRIDGVTITLSGLITANVDAVFSSNNATLASLNITNKITGTGGLALDLSQTSTANTLLTVTLNTSANANDYSGETVVGHTNGTSSNAYTATLSLGATDQIPHGPGKGSVTIINDTASRTGTLNLGGFSETINGLNGNGFLQGGTSGTPLLTVGAGDKDGNFSGIISNSGSTLSLAKIGNGMQTLSGTNTYSGATTVNAGTLILANNFALQNSALVTTGAGTVSLDGSVTTPTFGGLSGAFGDLSSVISSGYSNVTALTLNPLSGSVTYGGVIANGAANMAVTKTGTGTQILSGENTYTGPTAINAGALFINGNQSSASGAVSVAAEATLGGVGTLGGDTSIADNGKLEFHLTTPPGSHDKLELASGKTLSFGANATLTITSGGGATTGLYTLVTAPGGIGTLPAFNVILPANWTASPPAVSGNDLVINITSVGSAYGAWKTANAPGSNPQDDTDGDGVPNAVEFVLGGTSATKDLDKLPILATSGGNMTFTFQRAVSSIDPKTVVFIETSTDLVTWNNAPSPYTVPDGAVANSPGVTVVEDTSSGFDTVTLTLPLVPDVKKFARLKVVIVP